MEVRLQHSRQYKGSLAWDWERMIRKNAELEDFVDFLEMELDEKTKEIKLLKSDRRCLRKEVKLLAEERYDLEQIISDHESAKVTLNNLAQRNKSLEEELTKSRNEVIDYQRKFQESSDSLQASEDLSRKLYGEISDSVRAVSIAGKKVAVAEARLYDLERLHQSSSKMEDVSCFKKPEGKISVTTGGKHLAYPEISIEKLNKTVGMWTDKTVQIFSREAKGVVYSLNACNGKLLVAFNQKIQLNKIGRDSLYYVEPLIESIMGGLEGLINILDSDSGFASLEMQLHPDQAVIRMIQASKVSTSSVKSTKGVHGLPEYESCRSGNISVKVLEAATQRLTSLCSVLNDMKPICVLNHVFILREYMRDCFLANFRKRLLMVLRIENCLQCPSVVESLIRRHIRIIHLAEQHISMDLTEGIRDILLSEIFLGPVSSLQQNVNIADQNSGSALEIVCNWYIENIVKDTIGADVYFTPFHNYFKSSKAFEGNTAEAFTNIRELKSIFRIFGGYGFDTLDRMVRKNVASLLNSIETSLRSNHDALETISENINSYGKVERETNLKQILDIETVIEFCIQVGHALTFRCLLVESAKAILEEKAPLFVSLLSGVVKQLSDEISEKDEIKRLRTVANDIGVIEDHDTECIYSTMSKVGLSDSSWSPFPCLCAAFIASNIWNTASYDVNISGFNDNIHCLARCISSVIAGSELVMWERSEQERSFSNDHVSENLESEVPSRVPLEVNIKSAMQFYVKCSSVIMLDSCTETSRYNVVPKLIFMDQLCDISRYLPRSILETHIPYSLLRSIYRQHSVNSLSMVMELFTPSLRQSTIKSPMLSIVHLPPSVRYYADSTPQYAAQHDQNHSSAQQRKEPLYDVDGGGHFHNSASRKVKFAESSNNTARGHSPLPSRFATSSKSSSLPSK